MSTDLYTNTAFAVAVLLITGIAVLIALVVRGKQRVHEAQLALASAQEQLDSLQADNESLNQYIERLRSIEEEYELSKRALASLRAEVNESARRLRDLETAGRGAGLVLPPTGAAGALAGMEADIGSLEGLSELTERWHDQMRVVLKNNAQLKDQLESFEVLFKNFNVVAINASISAAKAGEAGKGFAVVAKFVRELAAQTALEASTYMKLVDHNSLITVRTFQEIQASGSLIKTAMFSLRSGLDRLRVH
jgi:hypothetical protein